MSLNYINREIKNKGIIKHGSFTLSSGSTSDTYINFKDVYKYTDLFEIIVDKFIQRIRNPDIDINNAVICGTPYGTLPLATLISYELGIPLLFLRKSSKDHGTKLIIENETEIKNVILIEDVITTGKSVLNAKKNLEEHGYKVIKILSFYSKIRSELWESLFTGNEIYDNKGIIYSMDDPDIDWSILEEIDSYICGIKIHSEFFNNYNISEVSKFVRKEHIFLIEDMKCADIPSIILNKLSLLKYKPNYITAHAIIGIDAIKEINNTYWDDSEPHIILIVEMSNKGNFTKIDEVNSQYYCDYAVNMARENQDCIHGIVCQNKYEDLITFTPGVHLGTEDTDDHKIPENVNSNYIIVRRAISESEKPLEAITELHRRYNTR